jgi:uncharacterized protein YcfJ
MNKLILIPMLAAGLAAAPVWADPGQSRGKNHGPEFAQVVESRPIYRQVRINEPRQECWDERVTYRDRSEVWFDDGAAGTVFGAIAGGVAGHQFGKGRGKDAATALGAIIGAGIGQRVALSNSAPRPERVAYEQRCQLVDSYRYEERVEAYDVTYRYHGRLYTTRLPDDPGRRIAVDVRVQPVGY